MPNFSCGVVDVLADSWCWVFDGGGVGLDQNTLVKLCRSDYLEKGVAQHIVHITHYILFVDMWGKVQPITKTYHASPLS